MAKITTKKPGQGVAPSTPPTETILEPVSESEVRIVPPVATSAVPSKTSPIVQKNIPQVKVTRTSEAKLKNFSPTPAPSAPPPNFRSPDSGLSESKPKTGRFLVPLAGVVLILVSLSKLNTGSKSYESEYLPLDPTAREMLVRDDPAKMAAASWRNDEPGFFGKFFRKLCLGYAKSDSCSSAPLHPLMKVADQLGVQLKFDKEEDKKVIEQTIEYKSRAFTFGK